MPCLLLKNNSLVKTVQFKNPRYVGDPINTVRIYNEQEVDELVFLDIAAGTENKEPPFKIIAEIASECFMPFTYGGGICSLENAKKIFALGVEKVVLNSIVVDHPELITQISKIYGAQSVVVSIDAKKNWLGKYHVYTQGGRKKINIDPVAYAQNVVKQGAGEILLTSINQDGMMDGYDLELIKMVAEGVEVPVIACGGAGNLLDFKEAVQAGASAVAAGSMVVYQGKNRAVLTSFPTRETLTKVLF